MLNKLDVAKIINITSDNENSVEGNPSTIYKKDDEIIIELTFNMAVAFIGGSQTDLPYLEIDTGTNRKLIRENPDWVLFETRMRKMI